MAAGTSLYGIFRNLETEYEGDLFGKINIRNFGVINMTKNTYNQTGGTQSGVVSVGGDATNTGRIDTQTILAEASQQLDDFKLSDAEKIDANRAIRDAQADPSKNKISNVKNIFQKLSEGSGHVAKTGASLLKILENLRSLEKFIE